jgi:hypothetical protein
MDYLHSQRFVQFHALLLKRVQKGKRNIGLLLPLLEQGMLRQNRPEMGGKVLRKEKTKAKNCQKSASEHRFVHTILLSAQNF